MGYSLKRLQKVMGEAKGKREFFRWLGAEGGRKRSAKKTRATRESLEKARASRWPSKKKKKS
jgi:hypothetical protein